MSGTCDVTFVGFMVNEFPPEPTMINALSDAVSSVHSNIPCAPTAALIRLFAELALRTMLPPLVAIVVLPEPIMTPAEPPTVTTSFPPPMLRPFTSRVFRLFRKLKASGCASRIAPAEAGLAVLEMRGVPVPVEVQLLQNGAPPLVEQRASVPPPPVVVVVITEPVE